MTKVLSRRLLENLFLYVFFVGLYSVSLRSLPPRLELFEEWVNFYLPVFDKSLSEQLREFVSIRSNDSNQTVNAPIWLGLVYIFRLITGDIIIGTRLPSILLSGLAPVLLAEFIRRFYRKDLAFLSGLALGFQQSFMTFARTGGYIGPTLTLFLGVLLLTGLIAFENNRKVWIPLVLMLAIAPFFYSTIRYYELLGLGLIGYRFVSSADFRKANALPMIISFVILLGVAFALTEGGKRHVAMRYISGRGEQFLLTDSMVMKQGGIDTVEVAEEMQGVLTTLVPRRLGELSVFYQNGKRFFNHRLWQRHWDVWESFRPWFLGLLFIGAVRCAYYSFSKRRYLLPLVWSTWAWVPLLVTTGITPNRMLLGLPSDLFMMVLGLVAPLDFASRFIKNGRLNKLLFFGALVCICYVGYVTTSLYYQDYVNYPGL